MTTQKTMFFGLLTAILVNIPFYAMIYDLSWEWSQGFPFSWADAGLNAFITFFHELGHTVEAWFYGYVALPSFDFEHGGGMSWMLTEQLLVINLGLYALLGFGIYSLQGARGLQAGVAAIAVFHMLTAYTDFHLSVIDFMGPAFHVLVAGFFLFRAWMNLAPRGGGERFLNAMFGFAMIFHAWIDGWALLHDDVARQAYFEQKGQHGFGDFDKISDALDVSFNSVVWVWLTLSAAGVAVPALFYIRDRKQASG